MAALVLKAIMRRDSGYVFDKAQLQHSKNSKNSKGKKINKNKNKRKNNAQDAISSIKSKHVKIDGDTLDHFETAERTREKTIDGDTCGGRSGDGDSESEEIAQVQIQDLDEHAKEEDKTFTLPVLFFAKTRYVFLVFICANVRGIWLSGLSVLFGLCGLLDYSLYSDYSGYVDYSGY